MVLNVESQVFRMNYPVRHFKGHLVGGLGGSLLVYGISAVGI